MDILSCTGCGLQAGSSVDFSAIFRTFEEDQITHTPRGDDVSTPTINGIRTAGAYARRIALGSLPAALFVFVSCSLFRGVSYYDPTTYKNLTDLKPYVMFLYASFGEEEVDEDRIWYVRLRLAQIHEYEKGKGPSNKETADQIGKIVEMYEEDVHARLAGASWNEAQINNSTENVVDAFDIAIQTERLKNRNE